jgi:hypothetical protein
MTGEGSLTTDRSPPRNSALGMGELLKLKRTTGSVSACGNATAADPSNVDVAMLHGAMRLSGWVTMSTFFETANRERFVRWGARSLVPKLSSGDVVIMDNAQAHHDPRVRDLIEKVGAPARIPAALSARRQSHRAGLGHWSRRVLLRRVRFSADDGGDDSS